MKLKDKDLDENELAKFNNLNEDAANVIFGDKPQQIKCEFCEQKTWSQPKPQPTYLTYMLALLVLLIFGFWPAIILIPCVLVFTQTLYHICPLCDRELGTNNRIFNHFFLQDKVLTINLFEIGLILTRKILLGFLLGLIITGVLFLQIQSLSHYHSMEKIVYLNDSWETFLEKCKPSLMPMNSAKCVETYLDKTIVNWEGYVIRLIDNRENFARFLTHAVEILIKMDPSDSNPDIYLTFHSGEANELNLIFSRLDRGRKVRFNGTIKSFGDDGKGRHLHGIELVEGEGSVEIEEIGIGKGRYGAFRRKKLPES